MSPYFSVGEEVILCSESNPHLNGDYIVETVVHRDDMEKCRITGIIIRGSAKSSDYGYRLTGLIIKSDNGFEAMWDQSALRKKHKPSGRSFEQTIKSLSLSGVSS